MSIQLDVPNDVQQQQRQRRLRLFERRSTTEHKQPSKSQLEAINRDLQPVPGPSSETLRKLRQLIRQRYELDCRIWIGRHALPDDTTKFSQMTAQSNIYLNEIMRVVGLLRNERTQWSIAQRVSIDKICDLVLTFQVSCHDQDRNALLDMSENLILEHDYHQTADHRIAEHATLPPARNSDTNTQPLLLSQHSIDKAPLEGSTIASSALAYDLSDETKIWSVEPISVALQPGNAPELERLIRKLRRLNEFERRTRSADDVRENSIKSQAPAEGPKSIDHARSERSSSAGLIRPERQISNRYSTGSIFSSERAVKSLYTRLSLMDSLHDGAAKWMEDPASDDSANLEICPYLTSNRDRLLDGVTSLIGPPHSKSDAENIKRSVEPVALPEGGGVDDKSELTSFSRESLASVLPSWKPTHESYMVNSAERRQYLRNTAVYLADVDPETIKIKSEAMCIFESMQVAIEKATYTQWDWWPFLPPRRTLYEGWVHLVWACRCGEQRAGQVPRDVVDLLVPSPALIPIVPVKSSSSAAAGPSATMTRTNIQPHQSNTQADQEKVAVVRTGQMSRRWCRRNAPRIAPSTDIGNAMPAQPIIRHVFLSVMNQTSRYLSQMKVTNTQTDGFLDDDGFFERLRVEYIKKKGWLRFWFGIYRYAGCEYVKFEKIADRVHPRRCEGLPGMLEGQYEFTPRPPREMPPIDCDEFKHRFYACYRGGTRHKHPLGLQCKRQCRRDADALQRTPKRDREVIEEGSSREYFWGLSAVEEIGALHVLIYHMLLIAGPIAFWAWWQSGHPDDLQDATAPLMVALSSSAVILTFWTVKLSNPSYANNK